MTQSLWADPFDPPAFPKLEGDANTDVLIVGGGLAGLLCAYMLSKAGIDHILIESDRICGGVTRNTTAKITSQHGPVYHKIAKEFGLQAALDYYQANEQALAEYRRLCRDIPCDFQTQDSYVYFTGDRKMLEKELAVLEQIHAHGDLLDTVPLPFPVLGAIRFPHQAQFHPLKFAFSIAKDLRIYEHTAAKAFAGNTVITDGGKIRAAKIIIATHFPILNKHGSYFLKMYQHRSYVLALENAGDVDGMYIGESKTGLSFRGYNGLLLLGGGSHRTGKPGGGWAELEAFAKKHYPGAKEACRWATQDCMTLDGIPYIGQYSKNTPDLYVATGFNKWGITSAMVSAMVLRDRILGKENRFEYLFSPSRTMVRPQLLGNILESTVNLLTPTAPRCPHLGCALKWNKAEHTWDCPCHGSRFDRDGTLLDNPATGDLKK